MSKETRIVNLRILISNNEEKIRKLQAINLMHLERISELSKPEVLLSDSEETERRKKQSQKDSLDAVAKLKAMKERLK